MKRTFVILALIVFLACGQRALAAGSATFSWSQNAVTVGANSEATVVLKLSTAGSNTTGADAVFSYDPTKIQVSSVSFSNPNLYSYNFFNNSIGSGVLKLTSTFTDVSSFYNGTGDYALITVKGLQVGSTALSWTCENGSTNDSNILQQSTGADIINCAGLTPLTVTVGQSTGSTSETTTSNNAQGTGTTSCSALSSSPSNLIAKAQSRSSVLLTWNKDSNASYYTLKYGTSPGAYQYGAANIGNSGSFVVSYLQPGTTYYFAVAGVNSCSTSSFITAQAKTSSQTAAAAPTSPTDPSTPSFTTIVSQVSDSLPAAQEPTLLVSDESLGETGAPAIGEENMLANVAQPAESAAKPSMLPYIIAGVATVAILGLLLIFFVLRKKKTVEEIPVTSVPEAPIVPKSTPIPPLGG